MARMIPLYSASSQSEIERRARELELGGRTAGRDLDHWLQAEAGYLEVLRCSQASLPTDGASMTRPIPT